jgi:pimeloyl-ACP methyl ester carboxylesterase
MPGFLASDKSMATLRAGLQQAGYPVHSWGLGRNFGVTADLMERVDRHIRRIQSPDGEPVVLVGWSLGGLIAREYAKYAAERVRAVVTLGSPFSGNPNSLLLSRLYECVAGHAVSRPPFPCSLAVKPPVPTTAIWSRQDGFIPLQAARGNAHETDHAIEVSCAHMAYPSDPVVVQAVIQAIEGSVSEPEPGRDMSRMRAA